MVYYNEIDPRAAAWLRGLIAAKLIPDGFVDERSITEVEADDLVGFDRHQFFTGIAGWEFACQIAGWGGAGFFGSAPCQPFSKAGTVWKRDVGIGSSRDLWPTWFNLIKQCQPPVVFGEESADAIAHGWIDRAFDDMESIGYTCGSAVLPACSAGSLQERSRVWFVCSAPAKRQQRQRDAGAKFGTPEIVNPWSPLTRTGNSYRGKEWLVKRGVRLLVDGSPGIVDWRCGPLGNAIVPQVAAHFIQAFMQTPHFFKQNC